MYRARARDFPNSNVLLALMKGSSDLRDDVKKKNSTGKVTRRMEARVGIWDSASDDMVHVGTMYQEGICEMKSLADVSRRKGFIRYEHKGDTSSDRVYAPLCGRGDAK